MHILAGLIVTAALTAALPEPAAATKPLCSKLARPLCHSRAMSYCSSNLGTSTTTITASPTDGGGTATVTAFPSDYPCQNAQNGKIKRAAAATTPGTPPKCLRKVISTAGDAGLTSACACLSIYPATTTVTEPAPGNTVYATQFLMQKYGSPANQNYAAEVSGTAYDGTNTLFASSEDASQIYQVDSNCHLIDSPGGTAYSDPSVTTDNVYWYYQGDTVPSNVSPIQCFFSGDQEQNMQCLSGSNIYLAENPTNSVWEMTGDYRANIFGIVVYPIVA